jgi:hypothetical protein
MTAGPTATARPIPGVPAPAVPRRRAAPADVRRAPRAGERARVVVGRVGWYLNKWFRQMLGVLAHPEEGFWELKRTGDWASVPFMLGLTILARMALMQFMSFHYIFQGVEKTKWNFERIVDQFCRTVTMGMTVFLYNGNPEDTSILQEGLRILVPFFTWCLAHYAIAMIFYGEGSLKHVAIAGAFSLTPFIFFSWPASIILTNTTTLTERSLYFSVAWITQLWVFFLFVTHIRVIHDFTIRRTAATYALGLITVVIIWALGALVYALTSNTYEFFYEIFYELTTR